MTGLSGGGGWEWMNHPKLGELFHPTSSMACDIAGRILAAVQNPPSYRFQPCRNPVKTCWKDGARVLAGSTYFASKSRRKCDELTMTSFNYVTVDFIDNHSGYIAAIRHGVHRVFGVASMDLRLGSWETLQTGWRMAPSNFAQLYSHYIGKYHSNELFELHWASKTCTIVACDDDPLHDPHLPHVFEMDF